MSQYSAVGPVLGGAFPSQQGLPMAAGTMQPGHNLHPVSYEHYATQNQQHFHPHVFSNFCPSSSPNYSRTPSPSIPTTTPPSHYAFAPATMSSNAYQNGQFVGLIAQWPMSGPMYPDNVIAYLGNRGPMPDLKALQGQLVQVKADVDSGKYNLPNPSIADPSMIKSRWTDGVDVFQTPWVVANPQIHGSPLPAPEPLPVGPANSAIDHQQGLQAYNGRWM